MSSFKLRRRYKTSSTTTARKMRCSTSLAPFSMMTGSRIRKLILSICSETAKRWRKISPRLKSYWTLAWTKSDNSSEWFRRPSSRSRIRNGYSTSRTFTGTRSGRTRRWCSSNRMPNRSSASKKIWIISCHLLIRNGGCKVHFVQTAL